MQQTASFLVDRRLWPRQKKLLPVFVSGLADDGDTPHRAWVADRCPGGIGLVVREAVEEGTILKVKPTDASARTPWVRVRVKNSRLNGDQVELGCSFVFPSWDNYLVFA
jgi:hypothetical protein